MQKITSFLWFDDNAEEAVKFYTSIFPYSKIGNNTKYDEASSKASGQAEGTVMTVPFQLNNQDFVALNGGPHFKFTEAISFYVYCESENEIEKLYQKLAKGGSVNMPLNKYDWSDKYAWVKDRFGVSWQLDIDKINSQQKIIPSLLFVNDKVAKVKEAVHHYLNIFPNSKLLFSAPHPGSDDTLLFAQFSLSGNLFNAMSGQGQHNFDFNESISFVVNCDTQAEIDHYWEKLSDGGDPKAQMCGWLKDKFGVSWQVVPTILEKLISDPAKSQKVMQSILQMKKIEIVALKKVCESN